MEIDVKLKILFYLAATAFISLVVLGLGVANFTHQDIGGACMFDNDELCVFGFYEHILDWQNTFAFSSEKGLFSGLLVMVFILGLLGIRTALLYLFHRSFSDTGKILAPPLPIHLVPIRAFSYFQRLFASGILNPKLF